MRFRMTYKLCQRYTPFMNIGVLSFQGDFAEHLAVLRSLKMKAMEVRSVQDLNQVERLIIPGGESTVMAQFLEETGVGKEIVRRVKIKSSDTTKPSAPCLARADHKNIPLFVYGTCAGAILLAKKATGKNAPRTLGLIDITIDRNAYGTQLDSFEANLTIAGIPSSVPVAFIRAPVITKVGKNVEVLASHRGKPVLMRQGKILAGTFHPEVRGERRIHELFLGMEK